MMPVPQFTKPTCRGSYLLGSACGNCERCAWERGRMSVQPPVEHMPWMQANREYDDGYNAGIAAAACLLKQHAEALMFNDWCHVWARHKQSVLLTAAGAVLALMRPERPQYTAASTTPVAPPPA